MRISDCSSDVCSSDREVVGQRYPLKSVPFDANTIGPILIEPAQIKATGMIGGTLAPEHVRLDQHSVKPRPRGDDSRAFRRKPGAGMRETRQRAFADHGGVENLGYDQIRAQAGRKIGLRVDLKDRKSTRLNSSH